MIKSLRQLFESCIQPAAAGRNKPAAEHAIRLATAALLVETARADHDFDLSEQRTLESLLRQEYELTDEDLLALLKIAEAEVDAAVALDQFTILLDRNLDPGQKRRILRLLWDVAFADGRVDKYEEYLIRKLADLLHLPHRYFIQAKLEAAEEYRARKSL